MTHITTALQRAFLLWAVCSFFFFWSFAAHAQYDNVPVHLRIQGATVFGIFLGAFSAIACGNLFYQAYRIYAGSLIDIIAKILLNAAGFLLAYEACMFIYNNR
jgi:hypothetical protein